MWNTDWKKFVKTSYTICVWFLLFSFHNLLSSFYTILLLYWESFSLTPHARAHIHTHTSSLQRLFITPFGRAKVQKLIFHYNRLAPDVVVLFAVVSRVHTIHTQTADEWTKNRFPGDSTAALATAILNIYIHIIQHYAYNITYALTTRFTVLFSAAFFHPPRPPNNNNNNNVLFRRAVRRTRLIFGGGGKSVILIIKRWNRTKLCNNKNVLNGLRRHRFGYNKKPREIKKSRGGRMGSRPRIIRLALKGNARPRPSS